MKQLEKEIGVRDLTPEEIQAMFDKNKELEALVREANWKSFSLRIVSFRFNLSPDITERPAS